MRPTAYFGLALLAAFGLAGGVRPVAAVPVKPQIITHLTTDRRVVALTFDACQTRKPARYDAKIIAILRRTHTPATLLLGGRWMETHAQITRELGADPLFELGDHSYLHPHMTKITPDAMRVEIEKTEGILYRLTGRRGKLFRPPYGECNATLAAVAAKSGLHTLLWSIETGDPDPHESARAIVRTVLTKARPGSIVIMHVNGRGWHSAEALPALIAALRKRGFTFVQVSQALRIPVEKPIYFRSRIGAVFHCLCDSPLILVRSVIFRRC